MKNSRGKSRNLDLGKELATTPEDVRALRQVRAENAMSFEAYLDFLETMGEMGVEAKRLRKLPVGVPPFEL